MSSSHLNEPHQQNNQRIYTLEENKVFDIDIMIVELGTKTGRTKMNLLVEK